MNELQAYTASILDSDPNKAELIKQWKIDNKWGEKKPEPVGAGTVLKAEDIVYGGEPVKEILETVKMEGDATGAGVEPAEMSAPVDSTESTLENGSSELKPIKLKGSTENYNINGKKVTADDFDFYTEFNKNLDPQGALLPTVKDRSMISVNQNGKKTSYSAKQIRTLIENDSPGFEDISSVQEYVDRFGDNAEIVDQYKDTTQEQLSKYQQEIDVSKIKQDEINTLISNPDLFKPYTVETEVFSGGGRKRVSASIESETIKPYENQLKQAKATLVKNRKAQNSSEPITQQEIEDQAKAIIEYQKQDAIRNDNAAKLLKDGKITKAQQREFLGIIGEKAKDSSWNLQPQADIVDEKTAKLKNGSTIQNINSFSKSLEEDRLKLSNLKSAMMKTSGGNMKMSALDSPERIDEFNKAVTEYNSIISNYDKKSKFLEKLGKDYQVQYDFLEAEQGNLIGMALDSDTSKYALNSLKRIYNKEKKLALNLALGTFNIAAQSGVLLEDFAKVAFGNSAILGTKDTDFKNKKLFGLAELGVKSQQAQEYVRNKYYEPITFDDAFSSLSNFGNYALEKAVEQAPIYAAIASGGLGMFAVSTSSGGDYSSSRRIESKQIGGRAYNPDDVLFRSLGYAGSEYVFGALPTSRLFKSLNKGAGNGTKREILDGMKQWWRNTKTYAPSNFGIAFIDKIGEGMTQVSQNLFDDSSQNIFRDVPEAVFVGGMFSYSAAAAPVIKGAVLANFSDFKTYDTYRGNLKMISSLESSLNNQWTNADLKENTRKQIQQLKDQNLEIIEIENRKVNNNLSREGFSYFQDGMERQEQLRVEAEAVLANEYLSKEQKNKKIKELSNEFQALKNGINEYKQAFSKTFKLQTTKEQNRLKEEAKRRLQVQGKSAPSTKNVLDEAEKIHTEEKINNNLLKESTFLQSLVKAGIDIKYEVAQTNGEAINIFTNLINARVDNANNSIDREQGNKYIEQFKEGINSGETNGVNIPSTTNGKKVYDSVVSVQNSIANERSETGFHEIAHTIAAEALSADSAAFKDVAKSILEYLKQNNKEAYTRVNARSKDEGFDEVITYFLEEVTSGNVNLEKQRDTGFLGALGQAFGIATGKAGKADFDYNFKGETDVIAFMTQLGTKIKDGTLTVGDVKDIQKSDTLKTESESKVDLDQADQDLFKESRVKLNELAVKSKKEDLSTAEAQKSKTEISKQNLETAKENLKVEEEIINIGAFKVSELEGENRTRIVKKLTDLNLGLVVKLAAKAANNPEIAPLEKGKRKTFEDFKQGYSEQLTKIINNYEPIVVTGKPEDIGKRISFGAYMAPRLKLRYGNVLTDLKKGEIETTSIDTKEAKEIADTSTSSSKTIDDKLAKKPSQTIKYKSEALENLNITKKEGETDKDAIENKVSKVITKAYKGKDITRFKQTANIPEAVAKLYADMFGITTKSGIKALRVKAQNFPEGDAGGVTRARQFLIDNAAADFARIPRTKDDFVKAGRAGGTGVYQTKLGKALYNKNGKLTGTLKDYIDIVSGKDVTVNGIEFNALVKGKKLPIYRDAQHIKAALDFHIRNRVLETLEPAQGKRIQMGAKFSKTKAVNEINIFLENQTFEKVADELAAENKQWAFIAKTIGVKKLNSKNPEDVAEMQTWVRDVLAPNSPKSLFTNGTFANAGISAAERNFFFTTGMKTKDGSIGQLGKLLKDVVFASESTSIAEAVRKQTYVTGGRYGKISESFIKEFNSTEFKKKQQQKLDGLKDIFKIFETLIKKDKKNAAFVIALLSSTSQGMGHFVRTSAPVKFYAKDVSSGIVEEHTMPASLVAKYLFNSAYAGTLNKDFKGIENNYFQGALPFADDKKLKGTKPDGKPFNYTAMTPEGWKITDNIWARYFNINVGLTGGGIDPSNIVLSNGKTVYETYNITSTGVKVDAEAKLSRSKANDLDVDLVPKAIAYDTTVTTQTLINALAKTDKALNVARSLNASVKKIRVFDFDDTLATSKSMVIVNMPNGSSKKINATEFAKQAADLELQGAKFDFTEFSKVVDGKKGPLFSVAQKIASVRGTEDVFVLTARPQEAAGPIKAFMKANGIDIPLANITGLGDGTAQAKAGWIMGKAADGYNDFYFADDAVKNVKAVKDVLSQIDVKSKVQLAKFSKMQTFDIIVNDMIEDSSGIATYKEYSAARAKTIGANKGRFNFFIPPSAEDFTGLLYKMLGKGKKGDAQMAFLKTNLLDPYDRAESAVTQAKIAAANDFKALKTQLKTLPTSLSVPTGVGGFTYSHAVRVAIWSAQGMDIPGLSKRDIKDLNDFIQNDTELKTFANELIVIQKGKPYPKPGKDWLGGNITSDIINDINKVNRAEYQQEWRENIDIIFSEDNLNKMEAAYGTRWRKALEDSIRRMKSGSNRPPGGNSVTDGILDWLNNSVGAVMFLNTRSALLQTISAVNFINWGDNNIVKAGAAFANQKQFWGDFMTLMNSDYLVERRNGLKINVSESEIADAVRDSNNKVKSAIAFLLSKGFVMTRFADSFAIATGGSTFYRNRVKALVGKGMEQKAAEAQAFEDFRQIAEESQQSSNPNRISQQQASGAGRVILAWANTPMQYARIQKRAAQDLANGRGDWKTNVSKIVYYGAVQNLIFNALQQAVFALGFGEDEDEEEQNAKKSEKISRIANGMIDSQLKGLGIGGAAVVAVKSALMELGKQHAKDRSKYEEAVFDLLGFSPPLGSKIQKINGGLRSFSWNMKDIQNKGFSLDNPAYLAGAQITTGLTNVPLDRVIKKLNSMRGIVNEQSSLWQKVALGLGWSTWDVGLGYYGGFDAAKVLTPEEEKVKEIDDMKKLTKTKEQVDMLLDLGLSKKEIKALGKEQVRVEKIIELQNAEANPKEEVKVKEEIKEETKPTPKPKPKTESVERRLRRQFDSIKDENKPDQVKTLLKYGLTKKQIRALQYEKNRVNKILELMPKNK